ncbi:MAG: thiamine pyrophosphate-dependent enzyme, partial [Thermofilaceae archaeon]
MARGPFDTGRRPVWCPGCGNYGILAALKLALTELGLNPENIVLVTGIGCHGRIAEYVTVNTFHTLHGRALPLATGVKLANPTLNVIVHSGDGDAYAIGVGHLVHAARRNVDLTLIVHNNMVFGLTAGQSSPTTPPGVKTKNAPRGQREPPLNSLFLALACGATFIARGFSDDVDHLKELIKRGVRHKGFALIDVLQPCSTFYDARQTLRQKIYKLEGHGTSDFRAAMELVMESERIPIGVIYEVEKPTF